MIGIIDYGIGNIGSIQNMLKKLRIGCGIINDPKQCEEYSKLILPGVGSFDQGMQKLNDRGFVEVLNDTVKIAEKYVLGICLGAQMMTRCSEEGIQPGLGWVSANTVRFHWATDHQKLKVPHMSWADLQIKNKALALFDQESEYRFYFVHSYHFKCQNSEDLLATANYGYEFAAAFSVGKVIGVQFHPEKSHRFGMNFFDKFAALT